MQEIKDFLEGREGYQFKDLNEDHQRLIRELYWLYDDMLNFEYEDEEAMCSDEENTPAEKLKKEIVDNVIKQFLEYMQNRIIETQTSFGDDEGYDEEE